MSHTQGPWKVGENHKGFVDIRRDVESYTSVIATVWDFYAENYESNASLIAAAPDMLEALEIAIWIIEKNIHGPVAGYSNILDAVRKARGEE